MSNTSIDINENHIAPAVSWRDYLELCKPRVVLLMLVTAYVGMHLATPGLVSWRVLVFGMLGIGFAAGSAAGINHLVDRRIDAMMGRTERRPIPTGKIEPRNAIIFSLSLGITGIAILYFLVNPLTAILSFITLLGYAVFYTMFLKHATPQNIVIGGAAGAAPPLLGWTAVTGHLNADALLLVLIIFTWTPPHFWALAIHREKEYAKANVPMLPVTHGIPYTKLNILLYTFLLFASSLLPYVVEMSGLIYAIGATILGIGFIYYSSVLMFTTKPNAAIKTFRYSIIYLFILFILLMVDHFFKIRF